MQRSVEQRQHSPKRRANKRRDPRVKVLGFSPRQWPFLFVLVGNWLFAALVYAAAKIFWHWTPTDWTVGDRIALVIKDAVFAILPGVIGICIVAAQRLDPNMWVGRTAKPNSALDINTKFILNTFEQFTAFFIANAALALYCPLEEARTLIILTGLFVLGRVLFWVGYHFNPYVRAFGFGLTFYPTVAAYMWLVLFMVFGVRVPL
ncbi:MAG: MAPEG family protein [Methyloceanibacter sp.]